MIVLKQALGVRLRTSFLMKAYLGALIVVRLSVLGYGVKNKHWYPVGSRDFVVVKKQHFRMNCLHMLL
jgi:hypothetical protein